MLEIYVDESPVSRIITPAQTFLLTKHSGGSILRSGGREMAQTTTFEARIECCHCGREIRTETWTWPTEAYEREIARLRREGRPDQIVSHGICPGGCPEGEGD
jgi:hypothetical protein